MNLVLVCLSSFLAVFTVLIIIALVMRGLIAVFPYKDENGDNAMIAAINSAYSVTHPGYRISRIKEINSRGKRG
ncbi:MAG: hypothetical protein K9K79_01935 [Desulfohalobiaceae bacterium]|nr:hypothetical protein [Desulfohalobiaceae bacterium]